MTIKKEKKERDEMKEKLKQAAEKPVLTDNIKRDMGLIEISGSSSLDTLDPINLAKFERTCVKFGEKIERMLDNVTKIKIHIKGVHEGGKQRKIEMDIKAISPTKTFAGHAVGWDVEKVTHQCFQDIEKQIIHHFKSDTSYRKSYA